MVLGERIRERREAKNLKQSQLAELIGNDGNTISRWEHNKIGIGSKYLMKLAQALETSIDYLLGKTNDPTPSETSKQVLDIMQMNERLRSKDNDLENPITGGINQNMLIIKDGTREYFMPNNEEGRKLFMSIVLNSLQGMGIPVATNNFTGDNNNNSGNIEFFTPQKK